MDYIIVASIDNNRSDMERISGFTITMEQAKSIGKVYTLREFCDLCNDERFYTEDAWITHVKIWS